MMPQVAGMNWPMHLHTHKVGINGLDNLCLLKTARFDAYHLSLNSPEAGTTATSARSSQHLGLKFLTTLVGLDGAISRLDGFTRYNAAHS